jgi:hypothetical protein
MYHVDLQQFCAMLWICTNARPNIKAIKRHAFADVATPKHFHLQQLSVNLQTCNMRQG